MSAARSGDFARRLSGDSRDSRFGVIYYRRRFDESARCAASKGRLIATIFRRPIAAAELRKHQRDSPAATCGSNGLIYSRPRNSLDNQTGVSDWICYGALHCLSIFGPRALHPRCTRAAPRRAALRVHAVRSGASAM